jgi:hypothetical protein
MTNQKQDWLSFLTSTTHHTVLAFRVPARPVAGVVVQRRQPRLIRHKVIAQLFVLLVNCHSARFSEDQ